MATDDRLRRVVKKRRGRNEGSVYRTKAGLWRASLVTGRSENGKLLRRVVSARTKASALEKFDQLKVASHAGLLATPNGYTIREFPNHWLESVQRLQVRDSTYRQNKLVVGHLLRYLGHAKLSKLSALNIQDALAKMENAGLSARMRQLARTTLSTALNHAVDFRLLAHNPALRVKSPRAPRKPIHPLNVEEIERFLATAKEGRHYVFFLLALETGLRLGELLALQWEDVDLERGYVAVRHTLSKHTLTLEEPKTNRARRRVDIRASVLHELRQHHDKLKAHGDLSPFVFTDTAGGPVRESNLRRRSFNPILEKAGLPHIRLHDLRHTHAKLLFSDGVNPKIVSERLGHASIRITLDTYAHVLPSMQQEATAALDRLLGQPKPSNYATLMLH